MTTSPMITLHKNPVFSGEKFQHQSLDHLYLAKKILLHVMQFRRIFGSKKSCLTSNCEACLNPHLQQVISAIQKQKPITFVLPAFPGKSPNPAKVLGVLPDKAELISLNFLNKLCQQIQEMYSIGAKIILCSDGRVFNDVVGIRDHDVTAYQQALSKFIKDHAFHSIATFNLDNLHQELPFTQMRNQLMSEYGEPLENIKEEVRKGSKTPCSMEHEEIHRQYCGMTRFLVEDAMHPGQLHSRNTIQKNCRERAYVLIQRSRAWSSVIAKYFNESVRLSIHPQTCGSAKLGIRLMTAENWMTPWHGVAVEIAGKFFLLKRQEAEELGAKLIYQEGRPSHYELIDIEKISKIQGLLNEK